jgi:hypothetical protein
MLGVRENTRLENERNYMKLKLLLFLITYSQITFAAGWQWVRGTNQVGVELYLFPFWESQRYSPSTHPELFDPETGDSNEAHIKILEEEKNMFELVSLTDNSFTPQEEKCFFVYENNQASTFYCENKNDSLLSGVSYKIVPNSNKNDCSYYAKFICTKGCDKEGLPKTLIQDHWECFN